MAGQPIAQPCEDRERLLRLAVIGTAAGFFSGIFGIGGGTVIVPLLVLWLGYEQREAVGTSLLAIVFIAAFAAALQGAYGNLRVATACSWVSPRWLACYSAHGLLSDSRTERSRCSSRSCSSRRRWSSWSQ